MKANLRNLISILLSLTALAYVILLHQRIPAEFPNPLLWALFAALLSYTTMFGIPIGVGEVSLVPMVALTAAFTMGILPAAAAVMASDLFYGFYRWNWPERANWEQKENNFSLLATTTANIAMHTLSVAAAGVVFYGLNGNFSPINFPNLLILIASGAAYLLTNYILAGLFLLMRSQAHLRHLVENLPRMLLYEAVSLMFAPLASAILINLGLGAFAMFAISLVIASTLLKNQASDQAELKRHIRELQGLQAVGRSLNAILDEDQIADAIYQEVIKLMPTDNFYLALYDRESDVISFPVTYEHNMKRLSWSRNPSGGLTEYVLETKKPLLIEKNVRETVESMGIIHYGQEALSWMGVPLLVGNEILGMIAVQAYPVANQLSVRLNKFHLEILSMIAAQAAIALQNARLYTQTDKALAQRVQVLNSILNTTSEGIALLSPDMHLREINRALLKMLDSFHQDLIGEHVETSDDPILRQLKIAPSIREKTLTLSDSRVVYQDEVTLEGNKTIPAERTISAVRDETGMVTGWLLVFRDLTEEHQLAEFREDLTHMLVHDLRSPVVSIQGGLDMIEVMLDDGNKAEMLEMLDISRKGSIQMLGMINELLNLNRLETGKMVLQRTPIDVSALVKEEAVFLHTMTQQAKITIKEDFSRELPILQGDNGLLRRVFHNLMDNAVKFTPDGGTVTIWGKPDPEHPGKVLLGVQDTGPGIPPDKVGQMFTKYYTSEQNGSRRRGSGLGLYFCKLAVEAHQGEIWAESGLGQGCNMVMRIPIQ